jgi:hypothetical protein
MLGSKLGAQVLGIGVGWGGGDSAGGGRLAFLDFGKETGDAELKVAEVGEVVAGVREPRDAGRAGLRACEFAIEDREIGDQSACVFEETLNVGDGDGREEGIVDGGLGRTGSGSGRVGDDVWVRGEARVDFIRLGGVIGGRWRWGAVAVLALSSGIHCEMIESVKSSQWE